MDTLPRTVCVQLYERSIFFESFSAAGFGPYGHNKVLYLLRIWGVGGAVLWVGPNSRAVLVYPLLMGRRPSELLVMSRGS
jgi:hypothetical protein